MSSTRRPLRPVAAALALAVTAALALAIPASARFDFKAGAYTGTTSQKDEVGNPLPLSLKVSKNKKKVTVLFFELSAPPCGGTGTLQYAGLSARIKADGHFNAKAEGYGYVKGTFRGRKASGTARYQVDQAGVSCDTGRVTWKARKSG